MSYIDEIGWGPDLGWPKKVMVKAADEHNVYYRANVIAVNRKKGTVRLEYTAAAGYKDMQFTLNIDSDRIWRYTCNANWWEKLFPDGRGNKQCKFSGGWRPKPGAAKYPYSPLAMHQQHKAAVKGAVASPPAQRAQKQGRGQQQQPAPQQQQQQQQGEAKAGTPGSAEKLRGMSRLETFLTFGRRNQAGRRRWRQASADSSSSSEDDSDSEVTGSPGSSDAAADVGPGGTSTQQQAGHEVYTGAAAEPAARQANTQGAEAGRPDARVHSDSLQTAAAAVVTPHRKRKAVAGDTTAAVDAGMSKRARDSSHTEQSTPSAALDTAAEPAVAADASCSLNVSEAQQYMPPKQLVQQIEQQADKVLGDLTALDSMQQPSPAAAAIVEQGELTRAEGPHEGQVVEQTAHVAAVHTLKSAPATAAAADVVPGQALLQSPQLLPDQQQQVSDREPNIRDADAPMTPVDNSAAVHNAQTGAAVQAAGDGEQSLRSQQRGLMDSGAQSLLEAEGRTPAFAASPPELLQMQQVQDGAKNSPTDTAVHVAAGEDDAAAAADMAEDPAEVAGPTDPGASGVKSNDVTQKQQPANTEGAAAAAAGTRQDNVAVPAAPAAAAVAQVDTAEPSPSPRSPALHRSHRQQQQQHGGALNSPSTSPPFSSPTGGAAAAAASLGHLRLPGDFSLCVLSDAADGSQWVLVDMLMRYAMITPDCLITSAKDFNQVLADFTAAGSSSSSSSSGVKVTTAQQLRPLVSAGVVKRGSRGVKLMSLGMTAALLEHLDLTEAAVAVLTTQPEMAEQSPAAANAAAAGGGHIHNPAVGGSPHGANRTVELAVPGAAGAGLAEQAAAVQTRVEANANGVCIDLTED